MFCVRLITFCSGRSEVCLLIQCLEWVNSHRTKQGLFLCQGQGWLWTAKQQLAIQIHKMFPLKWALHHNVSQITSYFRGKHEDSTPDNEHIHQPEISVSSIDCKSRSNTRRSKDHNFKKPKPSLPLWFILVSSDLSLALAKLSQVFCIVVHVCFFYW